MLQRLNAYQISNAVHLNLKCWLKKPTHDNIIEAKKAYLQSSFGRYEGSSNMNASSFITFVTYMLRQNGICFYKGLYLTFKLAPDLKKNTVYLSSYIPLNEGHLSILINSMLRTYTSDIEERIILREISEIS